MEKEMYPLSISTPSLDALQPLLPVGATITVDERTRTLSLITPSRQVRIEKFTPSELRALLPLLWRYPKGCSTDYLLTQIDTTSSITTMHTRLEEAQRMGMLKQELRPLRDVLTKVRVKLVAFDLTIAPIRVVNISGYDAGYILASSSLYDGE